MFLSCLGSTSPVPDIAAPAHQTLHGRSGRVDSRTDIEEKDGFAGRFGRARVVVNHVADFFWSGGCLARNVPVVSVKGRFCSVESISYWPHIQVMCACLPKLGRIQPPQGLHKSRLGTQLLRSPLKPHQRRLQLLLLTSLLIQPPLLRQLHG